MLAMKTSRFRLLPGSTPWSLYVRVRQSPLQRKNLVTALPFRGVQYALLEKTRKREKTNPLDCNIGPLYGFSRPKATVASEETNSAEEFEYNGPIDKLLRKFKSSPKDLVEAEDFNRWKLIPAATLTHVSLGSIYAWSAFNQPLMRTHGVVAPASNDWLLGDITLTFSLVMGGFVWGAVFSKYLDRFGPRACGLIGAISLGSGFTLAALAVEQTSLPMLYAGGLVWGLSNGWAYVPPVATLLKWFPDRKGFASGICVLGYGGAAMIAAPLFSKLVSHFRKLPEYLGPEHSVNIVNDSGKLFAEYGGKLSEVVVATSQDIITTGFEGIGEAGVYVVGTGATGVTEALTCLGIGYGLTTAACAMAFRLPKEGYVPPAFEESRGTKVLETDIQTTEVVKNYCKMEDHNGITSHNVSTEAATKSPQFWLLYMAFGTAITGAYGFLSCGKLMLNEAFGSLDIVTPAFSTAFIVGMSAANLTGRIGYTTLSDSLAKKIGGDPFYGRKQTYNIMFGMSVPAYLAINYSIHHGINSDSLIPLAVFSGSVFTILSSFGGAAATRPAIVGDIFGLKNVAPLSARQLSVVLPGAFLGPKIVTYFREQSVTASIHDLTQKIDNAVFLDAFGMGKDQLEMLISKQTVTIPRLMELVPPETIDPTPFVYDTSMYVLAGFASMALVTNMLIKPVCTSLHEKNN